jgi:preprotein translocase subunit Sec61beta
MRAMWGLARYYDSHADAAIVSPTPAAHVDVGRIVVAIVCAVCVACRLLSPRVGVLVCTLVALS